MEMQRTKTQCLTLTCEGMTNIAWWRHCWNQRRRCVHFMSDAADTVFRATGPRQIKAAFGGIVSWQFIVFDYRELLSCAFMPVLCLTYLINLYPNWTLRTHSAPLPFLDEFSGHSYTLNYSVYTGCAKLNGANFHFCL